LPDVPATDEKLPSLQVEQLADAAAKLPKSYDKLCRMLRQFACESIRQLSLSKRNACGQ